MASLLPQEASRVTWLVGDLMRLGGAAIAGSGDRAVADGGDGGLGPTVPAPDDEMEENCHYLRHMAPKFHLVMSFGVLHHCADPGLALRRLVASALLPGGVLQLGTYSTLGVRSWRPARRPGRHRPGRRRVLRRAPSSPSMISLLCWGYIIPRPGGHGARGPAWPVILVSVPARAAPASTRPTRRPTRPPVAALAPTPPP